MVAAAAITAVRSDIDESHSRMNRLRVRWNIPMSLPNHDGRVEVSESSDGVVASGDMS